MATCLEDARIASVPSSAFYVANFISESEEASILNKISTAPKPRWKTLTHRRLQTWPSELTQNTLLESPLPPWLTEPIVSRLTSLPMFANDETRNIFSDSPHGMPNHVLINEYHPGQGIMPHKDGPAYYPVVCTVSLGASLCLDIYSSGEDGLRESEPRWRILQEPRSLLITTDDLYTQYLHGIGDTTVDLNLSQDTISNWSLLQSPERYIDGSNERQLRTSLTYRDVMKVSKLSSKFAIFGKR
ncbi:MAG: hypothetical protein M1818_004611 [Claussenomyces sp. TS43310]|nr:MAG: hypothetical protein M1818_004611 [Claussenomyces sp. TS43310]